MMETWCTRDIDVAPGDYEFKFINGNNWGGDGDGNIDNENPPGIA